ncbi:hypothetical protein B4U79_18918, partial [Dinothrombium tinctorium]
PSSVNERCAKIQSDKCVEKDNNEKCQQPQRIDVIVKSNICIPAASQAFVPIKIPQPYSSNDIYEITSNDSLLTSRAVSCANGIIDKNVKEILVCNFGDEKVHLYKGQRIARGTIASTNNIKDVEIIKETPTKSSFISVIKNATNKDRRNRKTYQTPSRILRFIRIKPTRIRTLQWCLS